MRSCAKRADYEPHVCIAEAYLSLTKGRAEVLGFLRVIRTKMSVLHPIEGLVRPSGALLVCAHLEAQETKWFASHTREKKTAHAMSVDDAFEEKASVYAIVKSDDTQPATKRPRVEEAASTLLQISQPQLSASASLPMPVIVIPSKRDATSSFRPFKSASEGVKPPVMRSFETWISLAASMSKMMSEHVGANPALTKEFTSKQALIQERHATLENLRRDAAKLEEDLKEMRKRIETISQEVNGMQKQAISVFNKVIFSD